MVSSSRVSMEERTIWKQNRGDTFNITKKKRLTTISQFLKWFNDLWFRGDRSIGRLINEYKLIEQRYWKETKRDIVTLIISLNPLKPTLLKSLMLFFMMRILLLSFVWLGGRSVKSVNSSIIYFKILMRYKYKKRVLKKVHWYTSRTRQYCRINGKINTMSIWNWLII